MKVQLLKLFAVTVILFSACHKKDAAKPPEKSPYVVAVEAVILENVGRPSDAVFAPMADVMVRDAGGGLRIVSGWVDLKNDYGLSSRVGYLAHVGTESKSGKPFPISVDIVNPATGSKIKSILKPAE